MLKTDGKYFEPRENSSQREKKGRALFMATLLGAKLALDLGSNGTINKNLALQCRRAGKPCSPGIASIEIDVALWYQLSCAVG